jgi:hypothetical protein
MSARYISGFPALAAFIASDNDQTSAIFKRFKRLGARNLLHLESELAELEAKQDYFDEAELQGDLTQYSRNWPDFCHAALSDSRQKERKDLADKVRSVLREYSKYDRRCQYGSRT